MNILEEHFDPLFHTFVMFLVAKPRPFGMLNLSIREWVPAETYGGILLALNDEFLSKNFCNRSLPKNLAFFYVLPEDF